MISTSISKNLLVKFIAVFVSVLLLLSVAPAMGLTGNITASAETPVYDSSLGTYTTGTDANGNTVLTAVPNENAGFRGWFLSDGTEVSYNAAYTLPTGASASDYIPVFYNFNLLKNGGFEAYADGTNLSTGNVAEEERWNGITWEYANGTETGNWANNVKVTTAAAKSGEKAIVLNSFHHCTYKQIDNLKPNTQYTLTYYYNIVPTTENKDYLSRSYIVNGDIAEEKLLNGYSYNSANPYLDVKVFDATTGACSAGEWKKVTHTFFTGENTSVKLAIYYKNEPVNNVRPPFYIDDVSLVEDPKKAPEEYFDDDYSTGSIANWTALGDALTLSSENAKLNVNATSTYKRIQNAPFLAKKGATYTVNFTFNFANLTDVGNYINFSLTTAKGATTETGYYVQNSKGDTNFKAILTQDSKTLDITGYYNNGIYSNTCIQQKGLSLDAASDINAALSFKADKTTPVYLNVWINGTGTYTIDNLSVTEDTSNMDVGTFTAQCAAVTAGTAIRTEGKQGMRYKTRIDKRLLTSDAYYGLRVVEYGTVAIKADYADGTDLRIDGMYDYGENTYAPKYGVAYSFSDGIDKVFAEDETSLDFTGVLINIPEEHYNTKYTVRAYFKYVDANGNTGIFYANDQNDIAIYPVSKAAYSAKNADGNYAESSKVREYLYNNIISKYTDKIIKVSNDSTPIATNFEGIRSTIYHGVTFFPDSHGRTYTEAQAAVEMDRLVDTKVDNVRTRFDSHWMWTDSGWDWNSTKMTAFYKWAKMLEDRDISITIQAGWHLYDFIYFYNKNVANNSDFTAHDITAEGHSSIPEVNYLHGYTDDRSAKATALYGEDSNAAAIEADARALGLNFTDAEFAHYSVAAARYGEWIKQGIKALKAQGLSNVQYVLPFTESGDKRTDDETYSYDEWIIMTMGLNNALEDAGLRSSLKLIGPAQSIYANQNRLSLVEYIYSLTTGTDYANMIDINAMHQYTRPNYEAGYANTVYDPEASYSLAEENFNYYNDVLKNSGVRNMEFWCDEYFAHAPDAKWWNNVGIQMTQYAAGLTAGINTGVNRFLTWQMFDTLWDSDRTHGTGIHDNASEFSGGIHAVGTCPSLVHVDGKTCPNGATCPCTANYNISSYVPRTTYYGINLIGKYMNNENASVFNTMVVDKADDNGGIYVSAIKNDDGKNVILVVNTNSTVANVAVELQSGVGSFKRYVYDPSEIVPTADATSLPSDKTISMNGDNSFNDMIPAQSFAIYVEGGSFIGDDVNIPFEF